MADRDNIIRMAREAGMDAIVGTTRDGNYEPKVAALKRSVPVEWLERFAEAVRADFLQRTGQYLTNDASRGAVIADAVAEEREACARLVEQTHEWKSKSWTSTICPTTKAAISAAIRARGAA